jgi:hypothetical protein
MIKNKGWDRGQSTFGGSSHDYRYYYKKKLDAIMKNWPIFLAILVLAVLLLLCFLFPFRMVTIGTDQVLSIPGYAMLLGFTFSADGVQIAVPGQIFYIIGITGAFMLLACALWSFIRAGKAGGEGFAALAGILGMFGFLGQFLLEPGAYVSNILLPKAVRDLFSSPP